MTAHATAGSLGISEDGAFRLHFDRHLDHPVEKVWNAITDPELRKVWLEGTRLDPHQGGTVVYDFGEEGTATGEVLSITAPTETAPTGELVHTWEWEGVPTSVVTWRLNADDGGTRLQLTDSELLREPAADFAVGWHIILDTAGLYLGGEDWWAAWDHYEEVAAHYAAT